MAKTSKKGKTTKAEPAIVFSPPPVPGDYHIERVPTGKTYAQLMDEAVPGSSKKFREQLLVYYKTAEKGTKKALQDDAKRSDLNYYALAVSTDDAASIKSWFRNNVKEHLMFLDMDYDQIYRYVLTLNTKNKDKLQGLDIPGLITVALSGGYTPKEVEQLWGTVAKAEQKTEEKQENTWDEVDLMRRNLGKFREAYSLDLPTDERKPLTKENLCATIIALQDMSLIRIGNDSSAAKDLEHQTIGATTLSPDELMLEGKTAIFDFTAKAKGEYQQVKEIQNPKLLLALRIITSTPKKCSRDGRERLFCFKNEKNEWEPVDDGMVRKYLGDLTTKTMGKRITRTHNFRRLHGTDITVDGIENKCLSYYEAIKYSAIALGHFKTNKQTGKQEVDITAKTAQKSYIDPRVVLKYSNGRGEGRERYCKVSKDIIKGAPLNRADIIAHLRRNPGSKAWDEFLK